jgi:alpha-L-fucosidase 2
LPDAWPSGTVKGICARGGFEISMKWLNGQLSSVEVLSEYGGKCKLNYNGNTTNFNTTKGKVYKLDANLKL